MLMHLVPVRFIIFGYHLSLGNILGYRRALVPTVGDKVHQDCWIKSSMQVHDTCFALGNIENFVHLQKAILGTLAITLLLVLFTHAEVELPNDQRMRWR